MSRFNTARKNLQIDAADSRAKIAQDSADQTTARMIRLEKQVVNLLALNEVLWNIIKKSLKLDDSYLLDHVKELQKRDGTFNGRLKKEDAQKCAGCGKAILKNQHKCMYCGGEAELSLF